MRKRTQAFKVMKIIRETDPEYWDKLEAEGDMPELDITSELPSIMLHHAGACNVPLPPDLPGTGALQSFRGWSVAVGAMRPQRAR